MEALALCVLSNLAAAQDALVLWARVIRRQTAGGKHYRICEKLPGSIGLTVLSWGADRKEKNTGSSRFRMLRAGAFWLRVATLIHTELAAHSGQGVFMEFIADCFRGAARWFFEPEPG